jgi:DNA-directed RNA polymerase subunit E'/Rpb7
MPLKEITKTICLDPSQLNSKINASLLEKARQTWVGKCTKEDGYIISIEKVVKKLNNHISSSTASIVFNLVVLAEILVPEIGLQVEAKTQTILPQGIFCTAKGKLNILLPVSVLSEFEFDRATFSYTRISDKEQKIKKNDVVLIEVTAIRYEKNNFNCIGSLIIAS